jgi:uncharacterized membrane protein
MVNLQQKHMEQVREEMNHLSKINQELLHLRQSLLTATPEKPAPATAATLSDSKERQAQPAFTKPPDKKKRQPVVAAAERDEQPATPASHDWISKRIAVLEGERQSRWEKMKSAMFGK